MSYTGLTPEHAPGTRLTRRARAFAIRGLGLLIALAGAAPAAHAAAASPDAERMARIEAAVDRGLEYLAHTQQDDGAWPSGFNGPNNGVNGVCLLAFLGRGHGPRRGPYAGTVDRAVRYLRATQAENGLFRSPGRSHGPMYEHALSTLAIVEAYGHAPSPEMRQSAQRGVDLIVQTQNEHGGWRYQPRPQKADLSVTVMQVVALRAAMNARLQVPEATMEKALAYVRACRVDGGGFHYQPDRKGPAPARTAAGVLSMQLLGAFDDPHIEASLDWLQKRGYRPQHRHFWYMSYYAMQAFFQAGGDAWTSWHPQVRSFLLAQQEPNGSWQDHGDGKPNGPARAYSTAMALLTLEVYLHYLPAYQR